MELGTDRGYGPFDCRALRDEVCRRVDRAPLQLHDDVAGERIDLRDALDCVAPELDAHRLLVIGGVDLDRIATHAEGAPLEAHVIALVLHRHEIGEQRVAAALLTALRRHHQLGVEFGVAEAVNGGDAGHDDDVFALHEARRRTQPQPFDVVIDGRIFGDVGIRGGDIRFGLVVVVIGDEEFHGALRKERLQLTVELRRERFVVRQHECRPSQIGDDVRHRHRLARAGDAEQGLILVAPAQPGGELANGARLIARRRRCGSELKRHRQET